MRFIVTCKELGHDSLADGKQIDAADYYEAATKWAEREDSESADYWIVGGEIAEVKVTPVDHSNNKCGQSMKMMVTGESVPVYSAMELTQ